MADPPTDPRSRLRELGNLLPGYAIRAAATLRIPDAVADGVTETADIARRIHGTEAATRALLHYLAGQGVLAATGTDQFELTDVGRLLCSDDAGSQRAVYDLEQGRARAEVFWRLPDSIRTGHAAYPEVYGRTFWEDLAADRELGSTWAAMFAQHAEPLGHDLATVYDWSERHRVADLGGGKGVIMAALLEAHPHLRGTILDLEGMAAMAREFLGERNLIGRTDVRTGSFFDPLPDADVYVLSWILHDWPDDKSVDILANCAGAASNNTRILIVEQLFEADAVTRGLASMYLLMLMLYGGRERSREEFDRLGEAAGLVRVGEYALSNGFVALEYALGDRQPN